MDFIEFTAKNGAQVKIQMAEFGDACALKSAIENAALERGIDLGVTLSNFNIKDTKIDPFLSIILAIDSDKKVHDALFNCLKTCTYNSTKIIPATFNSKDARGAYYEIMIACIKENIFPFFSPLCSMFSEFLQGVMVTNQSSTSEQA